MNELKILMAHLSINKRGRGEKLPPVVSIFRTLVLMEHYFILLIILRSREQSSGPRACCLGLWGPFRMCLLLTLD